MENQVWLNSAAVGVCVGMVIGATGTILLTFNTKKTSRNEEYRSSLLVVETIVSLEIEKVKISTGERNFFQDNKNYKEDVILEDLCSPIPGKSRKFDIHRKIRNKLSLKSSFKDFFPQELGFNRRVQANCQESVKELNHDISLSIEHSLRPDDIQKIAGVDPFDSKGYMEDDDEDFKEDSQLMAFASSQDLLNSLSNLSVCYKQGEQVAVLQTKDCLEENKSINLESAKDVAEALQKSEKQVESKQMQQYNLKYFERDIAGQESSNDHERIDVLNSEHLLAVLDYLFSKLNPTLLDLNIEFLAERRKYKDISFDTYVSIIQFFLKKKQDIFLFYLAEIRKRLNISQEALDSTLYFYLHAAEPDERIKEEAIISVRAAFNKVYHAGGRHFQRNRSLSREELKQILSYQNEVQEDLLRMYSSYDLDVLDVMVCDRVYNKFGLERDQILCALEERNLQNDEDFKVIVSRMEAIQSNSFLNI